MSRLLRKGYKYYFDPETGAALSGLQKIGANYYYFDVAGRMQTGWVKVGSRTCYFKKSTGVRRSVPWEDRKTSWGTTNRRSSKS